MTKITRATVKSFIKKNFDNLYINRKSRFDGSVDCVMPVKGGFKKVCATDWHEKYTLGVEGAWFVGNSRDSFSEYEKEGYKGIEVYNCCGSFILAVKQSD